MVVHKFNRLINNIYSVRFIYYRYKCRHRTRCRTCVYVARRKITANEIILFSLQPKKIWRGQSEREKRKSFQAQKKKKRKQTNRVVSFTQGQQFFILLYIQSPRYLFIHSNQPSIQLPSPPSLQLYYYSFDYIL